MDLEIDIAIIRHHFHPPYVFRYLKNFDYQMLNRNLSNSKNINIWSCLYSLFITISNFIKFDYFFIFMESLLCSSILIQIIIDHFLSN